MKSSPSRRGFVLAVLAGASCLLPSISQAATIVVGTGNDTSYLVLESPNLGALTYEIHYTYTAGNQDTYFLLSQVTASDSSLVVSFTNYGTVGAPSYFINSINSEAGTFTPPYVYWSHWVAGGKGFQNPDFTLNSGDVADGSWSSGYGVSTHLIEPGSWDALYYSDGNTAPSIAPVPETSSALLGMIGSLVIFKRRRNR